MSCPNCGGEEGETIGSYYQGYYPNTQLMSDIKCKKCGKVYTRQSTHVDSHPQPACEPFDHELFYGHLMGKKE